MIVDIEGSSDETLQRAADNLRDASEPNVESRGIHIRHARNVLDMTQGEFAQWLGGYGRTTVSRWEMGRQQPGAMARGAMKRKATRLEAKAKR